jgi:hypothetical protein
MNKRDVIKDLSLEDLERLYLEKKNEELYLCEQIQDRITLNLSNKRYAALIIPDLQIPAEHPDALAFCIWAWNTYVKPLKGCEKLVINQGDEVDKHTISFHTKDPNTFSASQESKLAEIRLKRWQKAFPEMYICHSNHGSLLFRQAQAAGIAKGSVKTLKEEYNLKDGWQWANKIVLKQNKMPDWMFIHNLSGSALNNIKSMGCCVSQGHFHAKCEMVVQKLENGQQLIGITTGSLVNRFHPFLAYARNQKEIARLGVWVLIDGAATYIPMVVDKNNRWAFKDQYLYLIKKYK